MTGFLDLSTSMTLNDLEPSKMWVFSEFFLPFLAATHILRVNCAEIAGDRPGHFAHDIFLA